MNKDELIKKIAINRSELERLNRELEESKEEEAKLTDILKNGLTFQSMTITKIIGYLLTIYENKLYIPICGKYYIRGGAYDYLVLVSIDEFIANSKKTSNSKYDNQIVIVDEKEHFALDIKSSNGHTLTFKHLLTEYATGKNNNRICVDNFDDYPYIKEFISELASKQIENNGRHLTENELLVAMSDFISSQKEKPKTRKLNKNN